MLRVLSDFGGGLKGVSCLAQLKIAVSLGGIILNTITDNSNIDDCSRVFKSMKRRSIKGEEVG